MSQAEARIPRLVAASLAGVGVVLVVSAALIWGAGGFRELPTSFARGFAAIAAGMLAAVCYLGAGWLLASRIPGNPIGWLLLTIGLVFAVMTPTALLVDAAHQAFRPTPPPTLGAAWLVSSFSGPIIVGAAIAAGLLFPDGRLAGPRWKWALALSVVGASMLALATAFRPAGLLWYPTLPNPVPAPAQFRPSLTMLTAAATLSLIAGVVAMVLSQIRRYRAGDATVRAQLRWILFAGIASAAVMLPVMMARFLFPVGETRGEMLLAVTDATVALVPIAAAVAITRYHLFGIDFIIGRTLVYVPMMAILGGMYTASVAIFQRIFVALTGETSDAALVMTIFLVAATFTPIRKGLEGRVDRWTHAATPAPGAPSPSVVNEMDPAVAEVAARVIALRRFEARIVAGAEHGRSRLAGRRLAIDAEGRVACPAGGSPPFVACLGCGQLAAITTAPPAIACRHPGSPTVT